MTLIGAGCANSKNMDVTSENNKDIGNPLSAAEPLVGAQDLVGGWRPIKAQTVGFDSIIFDTGEFYYTHLNERPFDEGSWEFSNDTLILRSAAGGVNNLEFTKLQIEGNKLKMDANGIPTVWERIK